MPSAANPRATAAPPNPSGGARGSAAVPGGVSRTWQLIGLVALFAGLAAALLFSGAAAARQVSDPGALVRWGLPVSKALHNISLATVIGGLIFAVGILPRSLGGSRAKDPDGPEHPAFTRALTVAAGAGAIWTLSAIAVLVLAYADVAGQRLSGDPEFTRSLVYFMTDIETGRAWLAVVIIAAVVTTALFGVRSMGGLAATLVLALVGLVPAALIGHSSSSDDHEGAINSLGLHLVGVSAWVGGIIVLVLLSGVLGGAAAGTAGKAGARVDITEPTLRRFSALAGFAFVLVFASGVVNASIRVTSWADLFGSPYGQLLVAKTAATLVLGGVGLMHRGWVIPQLGSQGGGMSARRVLWQLVVVELIIMGTTSGIAVALGRSAPPEPTTFAPDASPAFILSGYDLPPELTPERWLTEWRLDWLWVTVAVFGLVSYFLGVWKVTRRGDSWSVFRSVNWVIGLVVLTYVTSGPPSVYGRILFSAHMVDHMALTMVAPIFLVLGAPVTLALRALAPRRDGSRGPREWLLIFVHSKFSQLVTHPLFAAANFAGSIVLFYYSDAFGYAMRDHVGHELMNLHFALTGYIFVLTMIGIDPLPRRAPYPMRLLLLLATMGFHAFFGVAIMGGTGLLAANYFGNLGRTWGPSALLDQQMGGAVAWGIGEVPTLLVAIGVAVQWSRSDARESKRTDRAADRNNDADLTAYNDMFAKLAERDAKLAERNSKLEGR
ncbi:cytochrome c oxidase assembly factor CtaG/putative copper export protein [Arthrobacter sp. V4I6]|uniref:cytochrome c oxidase assembly protein n=1 Tax=unclassified Arthrobacter TaxID=235627 RepID=UPI002783C09E|nr:MULTISPECIES: cytochrome c oxidase assembly protein [unclassified Arthrobacter]MDQ0819123.1 cytochrome c oxidase assembly factor CtaG/putative copper export protein [Arthrobacter sp. V1I7]MDQ0853303.1 cytochrome c oxidase assembly factor CtaG/putative copper export protein [Arthrobacter sp. V4I6]